MMQIPALLLPLALLALRVTAHMPAGAGSGTRAEPIDLGDPTLNSWALTGELTPGEVKQYTFHIDGPTTQDSGVEHRFYTGLYVPGAGVPDFTFYVAVFGLANNTACEQWGDGWGRRLSGDDDHDHDSHEHSEDDGVSPHRVTSKGTTWIMDSAQIPERVTGHDDGHEDHSHGAFDYHDTEQTLVFIASPDTDRPNKFESFSPTLFKPRGSCIAPFPRGGEYRIAVWGDADQDGPKRFSLGLGLAERDVFAPSSLVLFDYILFDVQTWNGWSGAALLLPPILAALLALATLVLLPSLRPLHYGTADGRAPPFRALVLIASGVLLGHMLVNVAILTWAATNAHIERSSELAFPLVVTILLPCLSGALTLTTGLKLPPCAPNTARASACERVIAGAFGGLHLFLHAGYLVAPLLLIIAAVLPGSIADRGLAGLPHPAPDVKGYTGAQVLVKQEVPSTPSSTTAVSGV